MKSSAVSKHPSQCRKQLVPLHSPLWYAERSAGPGHSRIARPVPRYLRAGRSARRGQRATSRAVACAAAGPRAAARHHPAPARGAAALSRGPAPRQPTSGAASCGALLLYHLRCRTTRLALHARLEPWSSKPRVRLQCFQPKSFCTHCCLKQPQQPYAY